MRYLLALVIFLSMIQCRTGEDTSDTQPVLNDTVNSSSLSGCYRMVIEKDTALMNIQVDGNSVTGTMVYNRFEKDDNSGAISGEITDGKIVAWYTFSSEGTLSVRQAIFKINGELLEEGYGDIENRGDTIIYKYPEALRYEGNHPYSKVICDQLSL